jgi:hypothetical protein
MACHNARAFFEVTDAAGRSTNQVAGELIALMDLSIEPSSLTINNEEAIVLDGVPAQDSLREVLLVHEDRLYVLKFVLPDAADPSAVEQFERLYTTVINSFTFVPPVPSPATSETWPGSAVVVYV